MSVRSVAIGINAFRGAMRPRFFCSASGASDSESLFDTSSGEKRKIKKSSVYTRTGDRGTSSLYNGERRPKTHRIFDALGVQDELCAVLGIAREYCEVNNNGLSEMLISIQSRLFDLGAAVATPINEKSSEEKIKYTQLDPELTLGLEKWIDELDAKLPPLKTFIIPSGGLSSTHLQSARAICRRAERTLIPLIEEDQCDREVGRYLNRLSDFLFVAARTAAFRENREEIEWHKKV